jgi:hypothetical protein
MIEIPWNYVSEESDVERSSCESYLDTNRDTEVDANEIGVIDVVKCPLTWKEVSNENPLLSS